MHVDRDAIGCVHGVVPSGCARTLGCTPAAARTRVRETMNHRAPLDRATSPQAATQKKRRL